jgi:hypothetical protein
VEVPVSFGDTDSVGVSDGGDVDVADALEGYGTVSVAKGEPSVAACMETGPGGIGTAKGLKDVVVAGIDEECSVCLGVR